MADIHESIPETREESWEHVVDTVSKCSTILQLHLLKTGRRLRRSPAFRVLRAHFQRVHQWCTS
jgi:hypothetical protein